MRNRVELLQNTDDDVRWRAVDELRHTVHPSESVPILIAAMKDKCWFVRALAAHAIFDLAADRDCHELLSQAVDPLAEALRDESSDVRFNAIYALECLGAEAMSAVPSLREAFEQGDREIRAAALGALNKIGDGHFLDT